MENKVGKTLDNFQPSYVSTVKLFWSYKQVSLLTMFQEPFLTFSAKCVYLTWSCLAEDFGSCTRASTLAASVVRSPGVVGSNCVMMHWRAELASLLCTTDVSWNMFTTTDSY